MSNALRMEVLDRRHELSCDVRGVLLRVLTTLDNLVEQLLAHNQFHYQVKLVFVLVNLKELHDVRVVQSFEIGNLATQKLDIFTSNCSLLDDLDSHLLASLLVCGFL